MAKTIINSVEDACNFVAKSNFIDVCTGKKVVFLEYEDELPEQGPEQAAQLLTQYGIPYTLCCNLSENGLERAIQAIRDNDVIIFQSQWIREISRSIRSDVYQMKEKRTFIEIYISEPTWYYRPDKTPHDLYILKTDNPSIDRKKWLFHKLSDVAYWNYENDFDH